MAIQPVITEAPGRREARRFRKISEKSDSTLKSQLCFWFGFLGRLRLGVLAVKVVSFHRGNCLFLGFWYCPFDLNFVLLCSCPPRDRVIPVGHAHGTAATLARHRLAEPITFVNDPSGSGRLSFENVGLPTAINSTPGKPTVPQVY